MYMDTHLSSLDDQYAFRQVFQTLPDNIQSLYMQKIRAIQDEDEDKVLKAKKALMTIKKLKVWIVAHYPPMQSRVDFIKRMKRIRMRRDEDPLIVWNRYIAMALEVDQAIVTINASLPDDKRMTKITSNDHFEICCSIFIHNNNRADLQNDGPINASTIKAITRADPQNHDDFKKIFPTLHQQIIPKCRRGHRKFKAYPYVNADFTATPQNTSTKDGSEQKQKPTGKPRGRNNRKRKTYDSRSQRDDPQGRPKRQRTIKCRRCKGDGHYKSECVRHYDVHDDFIGTNLTIAHCTQCGRHNHLVHSCVANKHIDGTWLNNPNGQHGRRDGHNHNPRGKGKMGKGRNNGKQHQFSRYDQLQQPKPNIKTSKFQNQQTLQKAVMLLGQAISGDDACNPVIKQQFENLSGLISNNGSPRKSQ